MTEFVTIKTIAERTGYSAKYLQNHWPRILAGVRPLKLSPNCRKILFPWEEIEKLLLQPK